VSSTGAWLRAIRPWLSRAQIAIIRRMAVPASAVIEPAALPSPPVSGVNASLPLGRRERHGRLSDDARLALSVATKIVASFRRLARPALLLFADASGSFSPLRGN
jgi:hypothetical protein